MKICVESKDLLLIASQIESNCDALGYTDAEDAEDDLAFYLPVIRTLAYDLAALARLKEKQVTENTQKGNKEEI